MRETIPESRSRSPGIPTVLDAGDAFDPAIRGLEEDIGVRLLSRTTRRVAPTEAGEQLLVRLRPALTDVQEALDQLSGLRDKPAGRVRLLIPRVAGTAVIGPKLAQFMRDYPDALLDITADDTRVDIVAGGFDAGIHFGEYIQKDMIAVRVSKDLRAAIVGSPGSVAVNGPLIVDDVELVIGAALDGIGLAFVGEDKVEQHLSKGTLIRVLDDWCQPFPGFFLYYPSRRQQPAALAALIDTLRM